MTKALIALLIVGSCVAVGGFLTIIQSRQPTSSFQNILDVKILTPDGVALYGKQAEDCRHTDSQIVLSVSEKGEVDINNQSVTKEDLNTRLQAIFAERGCKVLYVDPHPSTTWGEVVRIIDAGKGAGALSLMMTDKLRRELGYPTR